MTDKEKIIKELKEVLDSLDITNKYRLNLIRAIEYLQEEPVSEGLEEAVDEYAPDFSNSIASKAAVDAVRNAFKAGAKWQKQKDSIVSEDFEKASKEWLIPQLDKSYANYGETKMMELTHFDGYAMLDAIEFGAKWKEQQFEKNRLAHCDAQTEEEAETERDFVIGIIEKEHRQPTFDDAIKYGMKKMKEQMMAKAIDGRLNSTICGSEQNVVAYVGYGEYGKDGDKVKVIVIKED